MNGRYNVSYDDINELALPVFRHRIKLTFEAAAERVSADEIVKAIVDDVMEKCGLSKKEAEPQADAQESKKHKLFGRK
jgi:MoxR-like ATPase